jgi:hypothetical protein
MGELGANLRGGPEEGDLLAFIEGDHLPAPRRAAVVAYLAADPAMARRLEGMKRDMLGLRAMADDPAPADLLAGVEAALAPVLERQALLGIADGRSLSDSPPISIVTPVRRSVFEAFFAERTGRRIAMAAGLLLLVGGGTYLATSALSGRGAGGDPVRVARHEGDALTVPPDAESEGVRIAAAPAAPANAGEPALAMKATGAEAEPGASRDRMSRDPTGQDAGSPELAAAGDSPTPAEANGLSEDRGSLAALFDPLLSPMTGEQAARLLRQHRLVLRVRATDMSYLMKPERIAQRLSRAPVTAGWQVEGEAPRQLASAVTRPFPSFAPRAHGPERVVLAGDMAPGTVPDAPPASYVGPAASLADLLPDGPRVFLVRARAEGSALEGLRASLNARGMTAEYEMVTEPLPVDEDPALDAAAVLWWTQKPSAWAAWGRVPVVVDVDRGG